MLKKFLYLPALAILASAPVHGQLYVAGGSNLLIKSNTQVIIDNLLLIPAADLSLTNVNIAYNPVPVPGLNGASIEQVYDPGTSFSFQGTLGIYYNNAGLNGNPANTLELAYRDATTGNWVTTTGTVVNTGSGYLTQTFGTPVSLAGITATSAGVALPVSLIGFTARAAGNKVQLSWEMNVSGKATTGDIQRSADGTRFQEMATVALQEGYQSGSMYDHAPAAGKNYYRLHWTDESGIGKYSAVQTVQFNGSNEVPALTLYPQPVTDQLQVAIAGEPAEGSYLMLAAADGKMLIRKELHASTATLELQSFPAGIYMLTYFDGSALHYYKVAKSK